MFANPLYNLFSLEEIKRRFDVTQHSFVDNPARSYLIIKDNKISPESPRFLQVAGVVYQVIESHLTIPQQESGREGFFSAYHLTLTLEDNQKNRFNIHVYFDSQDCYCIEPRPCVKSVHTSDAGERVVKLKTLTDEEIQEVFSRFISSSTHKIQFVRARQKDMLRSLRAMLLKAENGMATAVERTGQGSPEHLNAMRFVIDILRRIEQYEVPKNQQFSGQRNADGYMMPNSQWYRMILEKLLKQLQSKAGNQVVAQPKVADEEEKDSPPIEEESVAQRERTRIDQIRAIAKANEEERQEAFIIQYRNAFKELESLERQTADRNEKALRNALLRFCELNRQIGVITDEVTYEDELISILAKSHSFLAKYCNDFSRDNYRKKLNLLMSQQLGRYLTEETIAKLALYAIVDDSTHTLDLLLARVSLPVHQQYINPLVPDGPLPQTAATATPAGSQTHTLLEWSVKLGKPSCFGVLLRHGHNLEHSCYPGSCVRDAFWDVVDGRLFLQELIRARGCAASSCREILVRELNILKLQVNDTKDEAQLTELYKRIQLMHSIQLVQEQIQRLKDTEQLSATTERGIGGTVIDICAALPESLKSQIRGDSDYLKCVAASMVALSDYLKELTSHKPRGFFRKVLLAGCCELENFDPSTFSMNKQLLMKCIEHHTAKLTLLTGYLPYIHDFQSGKFVFKANAKKEAAEYNRHLGEMNSSFELALILAGLSNTSNSVAEQLDAILAKIVEASPEGNGLLSFPAA